MMAALASSTPTSSVARPGSVALLPAATAEYHFLREEFHKTLWAIEVIEDLIKTSAARLGTDERTRSLWEDAMLAGRGPEMDAARLQGMRQQQALEDFASRHGFPNAERMAYLCGLPSPSNKAEGRRAVR